jgi:hypothetical protein
MDEIMRRALYLTSSGTMSNLFLNIFTRLVHILCAVCASVMLSAGSFPGITGRRYCL